MIEILFYGLFMGYTGAIPPGPVLASTLHFSMRKGFLSGFRVVLGHLVIEALLIPLLLAGIISALQHHEAFLGLIGGGTLIIFGALLIRSGREEIRDSSFESPIFAGVLTSSSNPYFWIWWATVGLAMLGEAVKYAYVGIALFITGHWIADLSWYAFVSFTASKTSGVMSERKRTLLLKIVSTSMILFGIYFILRSQHIL
jgi:threonine/homoserine/homoserine lactone efflux protein